MSIDLTCFAIRSKSGTVDVYLVMAGRIVEVVVTFLLSFVIGLLSLLFYVYGLIKHGPSKWAYVKKRNERPEILDSEEFGVHHWVPLKVIM